LYFCTSKQVLCTSKASKARVRTGSEVGGREQVSGGGVEVGPEARQAFEKRGEPLLVR
jgi:hypothetical protein